MIVSLLRAGMVTIGLLVGAQAAETNLPTPEGAIVLTVTGEIASKNAPEGAVFDMEMLMKLPAKSFSTTTIWTEGSRQFTGVSLVDLLEAVDADGRNLKARALNDYVVDIPLSEEASAGALVAYAVDGKPMSVRDKGPLWIVYPFDSDSMFQTETVYSRSIWQLNGIEVLD